MNKNYFCLLSLCIASCITAGNEKEIPTIVINYNKENRPLQTSFKENLSDGLKKVSISVDTAGKTITETQAEANKTLQTVATGAQILSMCSGTVQIIQGVMGGIEYIDEWQNPSPEKAARKEAAIRSMAVLKARDGLNKCLVYKRKEIKNT